MELLTIHETAQLLKVNPVTVRRFIAAGRLPAVKVGKGVRVRKAALDQLVTPIAPKHERKQSAPRGKPTSADDPFWKIIGMAAGPDDGVTDIATNKRKYLAEAYADTHQ